MDKDKTTMWELLEEVSDEVKDYWEEDKSGSFCMKGNKKKYAENFKKLMGKAVFDDEMGEYTSKKIASATGISESTLSRLMNVDIKRYSKSLEKVLNPILSCLSREGNLADDEMIKRADELLFCIFRSKEVKRIIERFNVLPENDGDGKIEELAWVNSQELLIEEMFGNIEQIPGGISYEDYFIDGTITEDEMDSYEDIDILFIEYEAKDGSKGHVVIFNVKRIDREYLHQRIRCLQRKDNVFAVLMVKKGECYDEKEFYQGEQSNIMAIEFKEVWKENSEICSYDYLKGICLSWYDEKCKSFMTEGIDKIIVSHK